MAAKMTPQQLREQAQNLLEQAAEEETRRQQLIGEIISKAVENDFQGFDFETFKSQAKQIWSDGKLKRKTAKKKAPVAVVPNARAS